MMYNHPCNWPPGRYSGISAGRGVWCPNATVQRLHPRADRRRHGFQQCLANGIGEHAIQLRSQEHDWSQHYHDELHIRDRAATTGMADAGHSDTQELHVCGDLPHEAAAHSHDCCRSALLPWHQVEARRVCGNSHQLHSQHPRHGGFLCLAQDVHPLLGAGPKESLWLHGCPTLLELGVGCGSTPRQPALYRRRIQYG